MHGPACAGRVRAFWSSALGWGDGNMPRPRTYRVEAIVLRRIDFGEADRVLVLYTRERGKMPAVAKGIRRISSRSAGPLELFSRTEIQLARGATLDVVPQAEIRDPYRA